MRKLLLCGLLMAFGAAAAETAGGIRWVAPKTWKPQGDRPMRAATYNIPPTPGDQEMGECAVFYFGPGQGGGIAENINRWVGQFSNVEGKPVTTNETVNGLKVTRVEVSGTYNGMGGPMAPAGGSKAGYRLLGAIVEGPQGAIFFKFTGPAKTVAANQAAFDGLVKSVSR
jgi:hypothetical protein